MTSKPTISSFVNTKKLKEAKASAKFAYIDHAGEFLVEVTSAAFGKQQSKSGGEGSPFFAMESKVLYSTSSEKHLQVGQTVSACYAQDSGNQAKVYLSKIKNAIEAILDATPDEITGMTDEEFVEVCNGLFFEQQGAVGTILFVKAVDAKNEAKEDRVYSTLYSPTAEQLALIKKTRDATGNIVPLKAA